MSKYHGRCDCGDIEYKFQDDPINTVFCCCNNCQLHTNYDKWFGVWVPFNKFKFVKRHAFKFHSNWRLGEKKRIDYFVEIALLQLVSSVTVLISIPCLPARSDGAKRYDLKYLSTLPLRLPGLLFPKEFQSMIFSRPANRTG